MPTATRLLNEKSVLEMTVEPLSSGYQYGGCRYRVYGKGTNINSPHNSYYDQHLTSQSLIPHHRLCTSVTGLGRDFKNPVEFVNFFDLMFELDPTTKSVTMLASSRSQKETYDLFSNPDLLKALTKAGYGIYKKKSTRNSHQVEGYKLFWLTVKKDK